MGQKKSEFDKVFSAWDILVIAFGAMIGWGWVVSSGTWIDAGGVVGAALAFAIGGVMIFFVGLTYAELTAAMPQCGGEHVFSYKAMGPTGSFICTWAIILGYVGVTCFEACAFPTIITYLWPGFLKGYLYTVAGFDIYASWLIVAILVAFLIMMINIMGAKTAAVLQTVLTCIIGGAGILLIVASVINGNVDDLQGQMFMGETTGTMAKNVLKVAVITPFFFIGFDVIPQAAEEIAAEAVSKFKKRFDTLPVRVSVPDELLMVPMDATLIEQVLINLMENAVLHAKGATEIELRVRREGGLARFSVLDNGAGIDPAVLPKLFEEMFPHAGELRGDGRRSMGIGLSVCMSIVRAHGGTMKAENRATSGACVSFALPMEEE